jgi:hypothetical protein
MFLANEFVRAEIEPDDRRAATNESRRRRLGYSNPKHEIRRLNTWSVLTVGVDRNCELKRRTFWYVCGRPQSSSMMLDDRTADG